MLDMTGIQNTLLEWIGNQSDLAVVWPGANDTAVPESDPYLFVRVTKLAKIGQDFQGAPDSDTGSVTLIGNREIVLSIQGVRAGSLDALENLRTSLDFTVTQEKLANADDIHAEDEGYPDYVPLSIVDSLPIQNLNGLVDIVSDERWLLEIRFRTHSEVTPEDGVDIIESVQGEGGVDPDGEDLSIQLNVAVTE